MPTITVVVGSGLAGTLTAYWLAKLGGRGTKIVIVDSAQPQHPSYETSAIARGASFANAGRFAPKDQAIVGDGV